MSAPVKGLGLRLRWLLFVESLGLQGSWNPQRMQNLGLLSIMTVWLRRLPRNVERDRLFCRRYYEFFNTNPYLANYLVGALLRLETEREHGAETPRGLAATVRDSLGRSLASLGDQLFWLGLRPALVMGMGLLALDGNVEGVLTLVGCFALGQFLLRWLALERGYALGMDVVEVVAHPLWHRAIAAATRLGMFLTGAVAGVYAVRLLALEGQGSGGLLAAGAALGLGLPLVLRRRLPGEVLVVVALVLALILSFANPMVKG
ncbi:MAG: PTS system mannose/fructose/sorbose family transporter subunit IID [bacterium]|nr:PTS system mannose/fructose/sorbose family transporter subunit IID [bacterium]